VFSGGKDHLPNKYSGTGDIYFSRTFKNLAVLEILLQAATDPLLHNKWPGSPSSTHSYKFRIM
jgi:hypothetical protein